MRDLSIQTILVIMTYPNPFVLIRAFEGIHLINSWKFFLYVNACPVIAGTCGRAIININIGSRRDERDAHRPNLIIIKPLFLILATLANYGLQPY